MTVYRIEVILKMSEPSPVDVELIWQWYWQTVNNPDFKIQELRFKIWNKYQEWRLRGLTK